MKMVTIRKNFVFDKELVDDVMLILKERNTNFTKLITDYLKAIVKNPNLIDEIEVKAKQRNGNFIGILDGKIGEIDFKEMKRIKNEDIS